MQISQPEVIDYFLTHLYIVNIYFIIFVICFIWNALKSTCFPLGISATYNHSNSIVILGYGLHTKMIRKFVPFHYGKGYRNPKFRKDFLNDFPPVNRKISRKLFRNYRMFWNIVAEKWFWNFLGRSCGKTLRTS